MIHQLKTTIKGEILHMKNLRNLYLYAVCLICICTILINVWSLVNAFAGVIWPTDNSTYLSYDYREMFSSSIMLIISTLIFVFHWKKVSTQSEQ